MKNLFKYGSAIFILVSIMFFISCSKGNIIKIEIVSEDSNIIEYWEYEKNTNILKVVKAVIGGETTTYKDNYRTIVDGNFSSTTIIKDEKGFLYTFQYFDDKSGIFQMEGSFINPLNKSLVEINSKGTFKIN